MAYLNLILDKSGFLEYQIQIKLRNYFNGWVGPEISNKCHYFLCHYLGGDGRFKP